MVQCVFSNNAEIYFREVCSLSLPGLWWRTRCPGCPRICLHGYSHISQPPPPHLASLPLHCWECTVTAETGENIENIVMQIWMWRAHKKYIKCWFPITGIDCWLEHKLENWHLKWKPALIWDKRMLRELLGFTISHLIDNLYSRVCAIYKISSQIECS